MKASKRKITLIELAKKSGYAYRTVAEVMSGRPSGQKYYYSEKAKKKILQTAKKLGYRPNRTARNFVLKRHGVIDLLCPSIFDLNLPFLHALLDEARKKLNVTINIEELNNWRTSPPRCLEEISSDGAIIVGNVDNTIDAKIADTGIPLVRLNCNIRKANACITFDEEDAMEKIIKAMLSEGRRRIYTNIHGEHYSSKVRERELCRLSKKYGLLPPVFTRVATYHPHVRECVYECLKQNKDVDTIFLHEHMLPIMTQIPLPHEIGKPENFLLICLHPTMIENLVPPNTARLLIDQYELAKICIETLSKVINAKEVKPLSIQYSYIPPTVN